MSSPTVSLQKITSSPSVPPSSSRFSLASISSVSSQVCLRTPIQYTYIHYTLHTCTCLMRDEKEGRKKQATCTCVHTCTTFTEKFGCNNIIHYSTCTSNASLIFFFFSISVTLSPSLQLTPGTSQGGGGGASVHVVHLPSTQKRHGSPIGSEVSPKVTQYFSVQTADDLEATPTSPTRLSVKRLSVDLRRQPAEKMAPEG